MRFRAETVIWKNLWSDSFDLQEPSGETGGSWNSSWTHRRWQQWCWRRLLRVPQTGQEIKPVNPKENQPWIFIGRTDAEAEVPVLWLPDAKSRLIGKDPDAGKIEGEESGRGWEGWMASLMQLTWTWANSRRWWGIGKTGMLLSMESWWVGPD